VTAQFKDKEKNTMGKLPIEMDDALFNLYQKMLISSQNDEEQKIINKDLLRNTSLNNTLYCLAENAEWNVLTYKWLKIFIKVPSVATEFLFRVFFSKEYSSLLADALTLFDAAKASGAVGILKNVFSETTIKKYGEVDVQGLWNIAAMNLNRLPMPEESIFNFLKQQIDIRIKKLAELHETYEKYDGEDLSEDFLEKIDNEEERRKTRDYDYFYAELESRKSAGELEDIKDGFSQIESELKWLNRIAEDQDTWDTTVTGLEETFAEEIDTFQSAFLSADEILCLII
jgi:hypothetical protein